MSKREKALVLARDFNSVLSAFIGQPATPNAFTRLRQALEHTLHHHYAVGTIPVNVSREFEIAGIGMLGRWQIRMNDDLCTWFDEQMKPETLTAMDVHNAFDYIPAGAKVYCNGEPLVELKRNASDPNRVDLFTKATR